MIEGYTGTTKSFCDNAVGAAADSDGIPDDGLHVRNLVDIRH